MRGRTLGAGIMGMRGRVNELKPKKFQRIFHLIVSPASSFDQSAKNEQKRHYLLLQLHIV